MGIIKKILIAIGILGVASAAGIDMSSISASELQTKFDNAMEVSAKYEMKNTSLVLPAKNINEVRAEIGGKNRFEPNLNLSRWNEVGFELKPNLGIGIKGLSLENGKIRYETSSVDYEMYDYENGYKYVWYLKQKPDTNVVSFQISSQGLDFFYQPPLDEEYPESKNCSPTECDTNGDGELDSFRPENVVGSYAVYHKTKSGNNTESEKNYKTGKAFHIYRPHLIDAEGKEAWGKLHIENGVYSVEIPQEFLDKAVFPIKSNDTFGYESVGGSSDENGFDYIWGTVFEAPNNGTVTSMQFYWTYSDYDDGPIKLAIYADGGTNGNSSTFLQETNAETYPPSGSIPNWSGAMDLTSTQEITQGTDYTLVLWGEEHSTKYDTVTAGPGRANFATSYPGDWPSDLSGSEYTRKYSIYATYTPSGGGGDTRGKIQINNGSIKVNNGRIIND